MKSLSSASALMLVACILLVVAALIAPALIFHELPMPVRPRQPLVYTLRPLTVAAVIALMALALALYAVLAKLSPALNALGAWRPELKGAAPLAVWGLAAGYALLAVAAVLLTLGALGRLLALTISYILLLVGYVGVGVIALKLGTHLGSSAFTLAGALAILSALLPVFTPVTWLVLYIESSSQAAKSAEEAARQPEGGAPPQAQ
jgi:hypothetical protein